MTYKVGHGFDVHPLVKDRRCIIGGVEIKYTRGLLGHSDADVLIHAIADAILGALGEGDIGHFFSDKDPVHKGIDSKIILKKIQSLMLDACFKVGNIDATIICEEPKIAPYIKEMKKNIAQTLDCDISQINIKATTTEKLGYLGRGEGIAAHVICLIEKN
ncbi:MAG: 2-C-methyl-D-erythritol 2,4-cyclodiphosphate synthase [Proteobacteria bacterium]|jgi:2-C-methyl-D-erythritol 2,4-cyclodiphosphate synthase|nr:2-C-methyl-D-erythritol 2,4-cyclodiphosphate synthase [Pseudomonadota bacterium]MDA0873066.1 2-C-methyl-D-erythritol 2,4-cyclodiphosphate synthase [Pseudomonadota bacterium]MDA1133517.1 2-C-methyl-D-erythritol 2,4-cyclodiphosphate synthase [Pseudomonadota bacterium]